MATRSGLTSLIFCSSLKKQGCHSLFQDILKVKTNVYVIITYTIENLAHLLRGGSDDDDDRDRAKVYQANLSSDRVELC